MRQNEKAASMGKFLADIRQYPMLGPEEEVALVQLWRRDGDTQALNRLVGSHMRLVVKMARGFVGYGFDLSDLTAEGSVGLMQAIEKFEPERGFRLSTYATWWIRAAIHDYVLRSWSLVKMGTTAAQKKLFFRLRGLKAKLGEMNDGDLSPEAVAAIAVELDVAAAEIIDMNRRLNRDQSLDTPLSIGTESETTWLDLLADQTPDQGARLEASSERHYRLGLMQEAMADLTEREQHILSERRLKDAPPTLEDLAKVYGVSRERVRQIEERAFHKLTDAVRHLARLAHREGPGQGGQPSLA